MDSGESVAPACWREHPLGCFVDTHRGWVPVARVDGGGLGTGLVGVVGGCAGESCCEIGEAKLVHGIPDGNVRGCGLAGVSSPVGAAFRSPMMIVGARRERRRYAKPGASRKSLVSSPNRTCVSSKLSCNPGPTHLYAPKRPSNPRSG